MLKKAMTTKTLYVDSRTRISGSHSDFTVSLPEQLNLQDARVRVDGIRTTDTFMTVSERNKYAYFEDGSGGLTWVELTQGAYTGTTFAAELAAKSGRTCTYLATTNSLTLDYAPATRIVWDDSELRAINATLVQMPSDTSPYLNRSINDILGAGAVDGNTIKFSFVTMAPLQDIYLTSHRLMVHESFMPSGQRYALAKLSLFGGFGTTVGGSTPENALYDLGEHLTLKEIDFQIRDYKGVIVPLTAPISFQLIFEC